MLPDDHWRQQSYPRRPIPAWITISYAGFFDEFSSFLAALASMSVSVTITRDVNIRMERALDPEAVKYSMILSTYNFHQNVQTATHRGGGLLDYVITSYSASPPDVLVTDVGLSDHMLLS